MQRSSPGRDEKVAVFRGLNLKIKGQLVCARAISPGTDVRTEIVVLSVFLCFVEDLVQDRRGQGRRLKFVHPFSVAVCRHG